MNKYGTQAMRMWQQLAPTALAAMDDPNRHFSMLGEEAAGQVVDLTIQLAGPDVPGETYFEKVGRLENAKLRAEEIIREELLVPPQEIHEQDDETDDLGLDPVGTDLTEVWQMLHSVTYGTTGPADAPPNEPPR